MVNWFHSLPFAPFLGRDALLPENTSIENMPNPCFFARLSRSTALPLVSEVDEKKNLVLGLNLAASSQSWTTSRWNALFCPYIESNPQTSQTFAFMLRAWMSRITPPPECPARTTLRTF